MKKFFLISDCLFFIFCSFLSFAQSDDCLKKVSWLAGTWKMEDKGSITVEEWQVSDHHSLEGKSFEVSNKDTAVTETTTISCIAGKLVFTFHPVLKNPEDKRGAVNFVLVSEDNGTYVFENKAHYFPQRVVYQYVNPGECHAWIEGDEKGKATRIDFYYKRIR